MVKLCRDCKHHKTITWEQGPNRGSTVNICAFKSDPDETDYVTGENTHTSQSVTYCQDERQTSTGFFGFGIDLTRCGNDAINFEEKAVEN